MKRMKMFLLPIAIIAVLALAGCNVGGIDTTVPTVVSTVPADSATGVLVSANITATFSEAMDEATITGTTFTVKQGTTAVSGAVTYSATDFKATFNPTSNLAYGVEYTATITTGAKDEAGNPLASNEVWTFTTAAVPDTTAPTVLSTVPADLAVDVVIAGNITATFSEAMDSATITGTTFTLVDDLAAAVTGTVTYAGTTATFNPSADLLFNTEYTATITTGAEDTAGNALAANEVWTFTTGEEPDTTLPTVASTFPADLATDIAVNTNITATFSEAMDPATITGTTFTLVDNLAAAVTGTVTYASTTATFNTASDLEYDTEYTATITTGAEDTAGNALAADKVWTFTTTAPGGPAAVNLGSAGNYVILAKAGITNVPTSDITGDVGLSPAALSTITGLDAVLDVATGAFAVSPQVTGSVYSADMTGGTTSADLTAAVLAMEAAYTDAAGRTTPDELNLLGGLIGGETLAPGLYKWGTAVDITSNLTLNGGPLDVWIFQIDGTLTVAAAQSVILSGGALPKNIFWQVAGATVTLGASSHFEGVILSAAAINVITGASMNGRLLAQTAVNLDQNVVTEPAP